MLSTRSLSGVFHWLLGSDEDDAPAPASILSLPMSLSSTTAMSVAFADSGQNQQTPSSSSSQDDEAKTPEYKYRSDTVARTASLFYSKIRNMIDWDAQNHIITGLFLGMIPHHTPQEISGFVADISPHRHLGLVVSVVEERELKGEGFVGVSMVTPAQWNEHKVMHHLLKMRDFQGEVNIDEGIATLFLMRKHILEGEAVYVHCKVGRSRSAMLCAAYMALFIHNPATEKKYTIDEAIVTLTGARKQVSVEADKRLSAQKMVDAVNNNKQCCELAELNVSEVHKFDEYLSSRELKDRILQMPVINELELYKQEANQQHNFKRISKRAECIDQILSLIAKPHSEQWYYDLCTMKRSFSAFVNAQPRKAGEDDKPKRDALIEALRMQVMADVDNRRLLDVVESPVLFASPS